MLEKIIQRRKINLSGLLFLLYIFTSSLAAQEGIIVIDEASGKYMPLGRFDRSVFLDSNFVDWFNEEYNSYTINENALSDIMIEVEDVYVKIVMGTWCSDSIREVPRFYKILDVVNFDKNHVDLICVDKAKVGLDDEVDGLGVYLVPTFIFPKEGKELGRIIESPNDSLEKDFENILK